jgi:anti-sigma B factor antagonist
MTTSVQSEHPIRVERHGTIAVITPSMEAAALPESPLEQAAASALAPLEAKPPTGIVMDLSRVDYFGSLFIAFLIRCHKLAKKSSGQMVVAGASERIRQLLHLTALESLWAFHEDRAEAVQALTGTF